MTPPSLHLALLPIRGQHRDLELRVGRLRHLADSYYLALDTSVQPFDESRAKVRRVLAGMLRAARLTLRRAKPPAVVLVPYDFSDQYTGLLRFSIAKNDRVTITRVYSTLEGWLLLPSKAWKIPAEGWRDLAPWPRTKMNAPPLLVMDRAALIEALRASERELALPAPARRAQRRSRAVSQEGSPANARKK